MAIGQKVAAGTVAVKGPGIGNSRPGTALSDPSFNVEATVSVDRPRSGPASVRWMGLRPLLQRAQDLGDVVVRVQALVLVDDLAVGPDQVRDAVGVVGH